MGREFVSQVVVAPDWLDVTDHSLDMSDYLHFCAVVNWRGGTRFSVNQGLGSPAAMFLSRAGIWKFMPQPFQVHAYRFTYEEAIHMAHQEVSGEGLRVNGRTHAEWEAYFGASGVRE